MSKGQKKGKIIVGKKGIGLPIVGALSSFGSAIGGLFQGFFQVIPSPLKIIIFLFLILVIGNVITGLFLNGKYQCDYDVDAERTFLYDISVYDSCLKQFGTAWSLKHDLEGNVSGGLSGAPQSLNDSAQGFFARVADYTSWNPFDSQDSFAPKDIYKSVWENFALWADNTSDVSFLDAFKSSFIRDDLQCRRLYRCLPLDDAALLGLNSSCNVDSVPEWDEYIAVTKDPVADNTAVNDGDGGDAFRVACSDVGFGTPSPVITFYGFDFLSYPIWLLLFVVAGVIAYYGKIKGFLE